MAVNLPDANKVPGDSNHTSDTNLIIEAINTLQSQVDGIPAGATGAKGDPGEDGAAGEAATITVGSTNTSAPGSNAAVVNDGDEQNAVLNFTIPRGATGPTGATGAQGAIGPQGEQGPVGPPGPAANITDTAAADLGVASAGGSSEAARGDHVHNMPSASDVGADASGTAASAVSAHAAVTTSVHGIADTSLLATTAYVDTAESDAVTSANSYTDSAVSTHSADTTAVHGIADTSALVVTTDARLSDARTPTAHATSHESGGSDALTLAPAQITGTAVVDSDARLTDARTPLSHAATHTAGGADEITVAQSQVTNLTSDLSAKALATDLTDHENATTSVHGITDTSALVVDGDPNLVNFVTSGTRPSPATEGQIIYETDTDSYYGYNGSDWVSVGGGATGGGTNQVFYENETNVTDSYTISTGYNAMSAGPITVDSGATVTVPSGSVWTVV